MRKTQLSVNINKIALLRNSRGDNRPNLLYTSTFILSIPGVAGLTVHPRPDERHIHYQDVRELSHLIRDHYPDHELNVEGYPSDTFLELIADTRPHQVTLVPDPPDALTSSFGWDLVKDYDYLAPIIKTIQAYARCSLFLDPNADITPLPDLNPDRVELYTYDYAHGYPANRETAIAPYADIARRINALGIGLNAGHDLNQTNLPFFLNTIPTVLEVSIGHALLCDALDAGLEQTIRAYVPGT